MLCTQKTWKRLEILKTDQITQYRGLGPPSWLTPTPQYEVHVCYLTTCKAPPEMPCSTPFIWIRRPEWTGTHQGLKIPGFIQTTQETEKPSINQKNQKTGWKTLELAWEKLDSTRWNSTSPKCGPVYKSPLISH